MSWRKHFRSVDLNREPKKSKPSGYSTSHTRYSSWLPEVYAGSPNRLMRYIQYNQMDQDAEINAALDIIAEFCTQEDEHSGLPFEVDYFDTPGETENEIITDLLKKWCKINDINRKLFSMVRNTIKYGDQVFIRDPETHKIYWTDIANVDKAIVNESKGKEIEQYHIRNLEFNFQELAATSAAPIHSRPYGQGQGLTNTYSPVGTTVSNYVTGSSGESGVDQGVPIDAQHVIHISLSDGMDHNWPFGISILEPVFKIFKQKELLEDSIIIYRVHRAPERRVFFIDVGDMPPQRAQQYLERIKYEVQQKRVPNKNKDGKNVADAAFNPMSMLEDYFFAQTCLSLDTGIPLLDGRTLTLQEIIDEYQQGKENWVYSQNRETNELEPGKIAWAGVTRKQTDVVRVHLDNGEFVECTPDHRFIMRDGSEKMAQDLQEHDSLMPLYFRPGKTSPSQKGTSYQRYVDNASGKIKWVHTAVCPKTRTGTEIHHIDFNSLNNNPTNLIEMDKDEHRDLHVRAGTYSLQKQWDDPTSRQKLLDGMKKLYDNMSDDFRDMLSTRNRKNGSRVWEIPESAEKSRNALKETQKKVAKAKTIHYDEFMFRRMKELYDQGYDSVLKITKVLRTDEQFQQAFRNNNPNIIRDKGDNQIKPTDKTLNQLVAVAGYTSWGDFKESYKRNHKVVKVERMDYVVDTGDITVESVSHSHIFLTAAGVYVHNSEGRGSKVDTLPGGENLGQIDDLKYFNNRLVRGLRVPSSYLPTGPDDGTQPYNDGKVGVAYIQEYQFSKYCERIQRQIIRTLDEEFKKYLKFKGAELDDDMFELRFTPPQNFSSYRELDMDSARAGLLQSVDGFAYLSNQFKLKRYLGLTDAEMQENEKLWRAENSYEMERDQDTELGLQSVGVAPAPNQMVSPELDMDMEIPGEDMGGEEMGGETPAEPTAPEGGAEV